MAMRRRRPIWGARAIASRVTSGASSLRLSAIRAVAYRMQVKRYGGLKPAVRRQLRKVADGGSARAAANVKSAGIAPGMRLIREWNGSSHVVEAVDGGFVWNGARYGSLSAVARAITGARWSGPRFFGLESDEAR